MNTRNNGVLIKAARLIDEFAEELKSSSTVPGKYPPEWVSPDDAIAYRNLTLTADQLRAITLEKNP